MTAESLSTSLRDAPLRQTRDRARSLMPTLGISECTDATAHDQLGVPVWFSRRCRGVVGRIHAGKGLLPMEAEVGALMEALEVATIECADAEPAEGHAPLHELLQPFGGEVQPADLAPRLGVRLDPAQVLPFETCEDIATGRGHRMPAELLRLLPPAGAQASPGGAGDADDGLLFGPSSNGLASGNSLAEATLHGLLEVLERDCVALDMARPRGDRLLPDSLPPPFADWHERWGRQGIRLSLRMLHNDFGLACIQAEILSEPPAPAARNRGYGCHPSARIALARAVTEAAQSRLHALRHGSEAERRRALAAPALTVRAERHFSEVPDRPTAPVPELLAEVCRRLQAQGLRHVLRRRIRGAHAAALDACGFHVVKVLVPGCETPVGERPRIGRRLAQHIVQAGLARP